ncbi:hypothetical protein Cni_G01012 [Canna indica]|uniref:WPP domain-containing protein n=1 Tax=Canna indica TaxID=4628 RepID=A0AAQ3JNV2_9LILI|nr:hypothetical protein Cni_G01012 [Canna indica]
MVTMDDGESSKPHAGENASKESDDPGSVVMAAPATDPAASFNIWPPSQRTRDAVIQRLIETLSSPSLLNKHYGLVPVDEATSTAGLIEQEAFAAAKSNGIPSSDDQGLKVLEIYSKDISKRTMEYVTSRASPASSTVTTDAAGTLKSVPAESVSASPNVDEEISSVERESA